MPIAYPSRFIQYCRVYKRSVAPLPCKMENVSSMAPKLEAWKIPEGTTQRKCHGSFSRATSERITTPSERKPCTMCGRQGTMLRAVAGGHGRIHSFYYHV